MWSDVDAQLDDTLTQAPWPYVSLHLTELNNWHPFTSQNTIVIDFRSLRLQFEIPCLNNSGIFDEIVMKTNVIYKRVYEYMRYYSKFIWNWCWKILLTLKSRYHFVSRKSVFTFILIISSFFFFLSSFSFFFFHFSLLNFSFFLSFFSVVPFFLYQNLVIILFLERVSSHFYFYNFLFFLFSLLFFFLSFSFIFVFWIFLSFFLSFFLNFWLFLCFNIKKLKNFLLTDLSLLWCNYP